MDSTDFHLFVRAREGDRRAQEHLIERHRESVLTVCRHQLRNHPDAVEDICQETFLRLLGSLDRIREPAKLSHWLSKVAVNQCRKHRRRAEKQHVALSPAPVESDPAEVVVDRMAVRAVLCGVATGQATILAAHYIQDRPVASIEAETGLSSGSGKVLLHRARRAARSMAEALDVRSLLPVGLLRWGRSVRDRAGQTDPALLAGLVANTLAASVVTISGLVGGVGAAPPSGTPVPRGAHEPAGPEAVPSGTRADRASVVPPARRAERPAGAPESSVQAADQRWVWLDEMEVPGTERSIASSSDEPREYQFGIRAGVEAEGSRGVVAVTIHGDPGDREGAYEAGCDVAEASPALTYCER